MSTLPDNTTTVPYQVPEIVSGFSNLGPQIKRWSREEYYRLGELGWFQNERVELIDGEILVMSPQSYGHANAIHLVFAMLTNAFGSKFSVRMQVPLIGGASTEPEPDISVIPGSWDDYSDHPQIAVLILEVSISTLQFDKTKKANLYASMGVPDYWVLDLENRQLLVHRRPVADESVLFGHRYQQAQTLPADGHVSPLEKPDAKLAFADMLPPKK